MFTFRYNGVFTPPEVCSILGGWLQAIAAKGALLRLQKALVTRRSRTASLFTEAGYVNDSAFFWPIEL